ncbi:MAG: Fe-S cluster assembly protein SufD [Paraglaciecola psychrophila]|jgi:Fe-S cluster assembly protein SufD
MSNWLAGAITRAEQVDDWLSPRRQQSLALLRDSAWPTRKTEAWKYTPLRAIESAELAPSAQVEVPHSALAGVVGNSIDLTFVDGRLQGLEALTLPPGLLISSLDSASGSQQDWALAGFSAVKPERHLFGLVNDVLAREGLIIDVAAGAQIDRPIHVAHLFSAGQEAHTRILLRLGEGASATLVEHFQGSEHSINTGFSEYDLAAEAQLQHYRFALQTGSALSVGGCHFKLGSKAQLNSTVIGFGSNLSRLDVDIIHAGEGTHAKLNALYLLDGDELFDLHSTVEHSSAFGTTVENVRGIAAGRSRAVFNGRIHIHRDAQKTLAELNNHNLLMSDKAQINTKPELEIYADDVRCAHGATVSAIDTGSLFYLQSRGIGRDQAQILLSFGFINELVEQMPCQLLAEWLRPQLRQRFAQMEVK